MSRTTCLLLAVALGGCGGGIGRDVRVAVGSPVGAAPSARADAFPVYIDVENGGDRAIRLESVATRIAIERDGRTVCADAEFTPIRLRGEDAVVPPRSVRRLVRSLPCAIEEGGDYEIVAEVRLGLGEARTHALTLVSPDLVTSSGAAIEASATPRPAPAR
jgi:hypothetical protein